MEKFLGLETVLKLESEKHIVIRHIFNIENGSILRNQEPETRKFRQKIACRFYSIWKCANEMIDSRDEEYENESAGNWYKGK